MFHQLGHQNCLKCFTVYLRVFDAFTTPILSSYNAKVSPMNLPYSEHVDIDLAYH